MNAGVLFTGGKDSCLALLKAKQQGLQIKFLLAIIPSSYDSWMWHKPSLMLLEAQAKALGIPLILQKSTDEQEKNLEDLKKLLENAKSQGIECIITGGVSSKYQGERIEKIARKLGLKVFAPIWGIKSAELWQECLKNKFGVIITKIACEGIPADFLGKPVEKHFNELLRLSKEYSFDLIAEGGDFETTVLDMPLFKKKIEVEGEIKSETAYRHFFVIKKVRLACK